jgi:hypothetical protein
MKTLSPLSLLTGLLALGALSEAASAAPQKTGGPLVTTQKRPTPKPPKRQPRPGEVVNPPVVPGPGVQLPPAGGPSPTIIKNIDLNFTVTGEGRKGNFISLSARLRFGGDPLTGKRINFYDGSRFVGSATTDTNGEATLNVQISTTERRRQLSFRAEFAGDVAYKRATATASIGVAP